MIISTNNDKIKYIRSLKEKKFREKYGVFVVEGIKSVNEALKKAQVEFVVCTSLYENDFSCEVLTVSESVFKSLSDEVNPQGVLAVVKMPKFQTNFTELKTCLLLDKVRDPGNMGTVLRTAVASGYKNILLIDCVDPFNPKTVRASMGGIFGVNLYQANYESIKELKSPLIVADMCGESVFTFTAPSEFCLVIGNEANGVSAEIKSIATHTVSIPMQGDIESLNAGVSAGILMYLLKNNK